VTDIDEMAETGVDQQQQKQKPWFRPSQDDDNDLGGTASSGEMQHAASKSKLLQPGMKVTVQGAKGIYCSIGGGTALCDSKHAGKYEILTVVDAGSNRVGLTTEDDGQVQVPPSSALEVSDLTGSMVSLKNNGKYCSHHIPFTCKADKVGSDETFKVSCVEDCPEGTTTRPVCSEAVTTSSTKPAADLITPKQEATANTSCKEKDYGYVASNGKFEPGSWSRFPSCALS